MNRRQFICKTGKSAFAGVAALLLSDASPLTAETTKKTQLNIIIIKTDQLRWDFLGCMGHKVIKTPNIDRLAKESFVLENEFTVSTICVPSRTSFFTGKYVHRTAKTSNKMDEHIKVSDWSFIKPLKERGYAVGLAGKNHTFHDEYFKKYFDYREETSHHGKTHGIITDDDKKVRAYLRNDPRPGFGNKVMLSGLIPGPMPFPEEKCPAYRIAEDGINFLELYKNKPFLLYYSFGDPHFPQVAPEPYYSMYNPEGVIIEAEGMDWTGHPFRHFVQSQEDGWKDMNDTERRRVVATYYAQITFVDKAVGMLLDKLKELGLEKKTIVFFTSDHGDWGGRYGQIAKTGGFQEPLIRIPGILRIPSMSNGQHINAQISNIDIMPTIFDYLNIPYPDDVQGKSFLSVLKGEKKEHRDVIFAEVGQPVPPPEPFSVKDYEKIAGPQREKDVWWFIGYTTKGRMAMIRKNGWKYCYYTGDLNELYDLENDPFEKKNLVNNPKYRSKRNELKNELMEWLLNEPVKGI